MAYNSKSRLYLRLGAIAFAASCIMLLLVHGFQSKFAFQGVVKPMQEITWDAKEYYRRNPDELASAEKVKVGIYIDSLIDLNLLNSTYKATGWMWYEWKLDCNAQCNAVKADDTYGSFDLNYVSDDANKQDSTFGDPVDWTETGLPPGTFWNEVEFAGSMYTTLDLKKFPFDTQRLQLKVTSPEYEADELKYSFAEFVAPPSQLIVPGYQVLGTRRLETVRQYASKFGFIGDENNTTQSQLIGEVVISRSSLASLLKFFLPVTLVTAITVTTLSLRIQYWEIKLASPATAILSLLFLQDGFKTGLPLTSYITVIDFYCIISYAILFLIFLDSCIAILKLLASKKSGTSFTMPEGIASTVPGRLSIATFIASPILTYVFFLLY